jgi:hypothetical protein
MAATKTKSNGDVVLANTMPKAEYMYGCMPTSIGMLLGYYDLYGYNGTKMTNLISGTVALNSRGTDGDKYDMDAFDTVLGKAIASTGYVKRFYGTTPEEELPYTYKGSTTDLNTSEWDCIADYLGTGQYWRGNTDKSTTETQNNTLNDLYTKNYSSGTLTYGSITRTIPWRSISMLYGLDLYVQSRGYSLDRNNTASFNVDTNGGSFTFEDFKKEIDAGRPVIVSITGHAMVAYGYNPSTREIIFDDCYDADQRMTWGSTYYYSGAARSIESITTIVFKVNGGSATGDTTKPTVSNIKVSTTAPTNKSVTVTATFSDDVKVQSSYYRIGDSGSWTAYPSGGVTVTKNATVYFQAVDTSGNKSAVASCKITNIDTTAPSKPTITVSTKKTTSNPVTVTAKFSSDSSKKEYSTDGKTWKTYSSALTFKANGTAYFRGTDAAGNVSAVASYTVSNIKGSAPAPTPAPTSSDCDTQYNDWMYNAKTHKANTSLYFNTLSKSSTELPVDKSGTVNSGGKHNFVGYEDAIDYKIFRLDSAAKLSFAVTATGAAKFKVYALVDTGRKDGSGNSICKVKTLKTVTLKKKSSSNYVGYIKNLLLKKNDSSIEYYVSMAPTKASKKKGVYYNVQVDSSSVFFTMGNNSDDSSAVGSMKSLSVGSPGAKLLGDWVGFGDKVDYRKFTLSSAAWLGFSVYAGDAAKFTLYKVVSKTKHGAVTYSLKAVQTVTVGKGKTKPTCLRLLQSGTYAISVKSTNASKGGNADYTVTVSSNSVFFNHADRNNSDDKVLASGYVNSAVGNVGYLDGKSFNTVIVPKGWVGYGDTIDYKRFHLSNNADLTFGIQAGDKVQFTIYQLVTKKTGKGYKVSLKKLKSKTAKGNGAGSYLANDIKVSLKAGTDYYFSVKSTNASKGGNAEYFVFVTANPYGSSHSAALTGPEENWDPAAEAQASALTMPSAQTGAAAGADGPDMSFADCGAVQPEFLLPSAVMPDAAETFAGAMSLQTGEQLNGGASSSSLRSLANLA